MIDQHTKEIEFNLVFILAIDWILNCSPWHNAVKSAETASIVYLINVMDFLLLLLSVLFAFINEKNEIRNKKNAQNEYHFFGFWAVFVFQLH